MPRTVAPNRLLEEGWVEETEVASFLKLVTPGDLAAQLRSENGERWDRSRWARLWSSCPELWADAEERRDLVALARSVRRNVLELERLATTVSGRFGPPRDRRDAVVRWHDEMIHRGEPHLHVFLACTRFDLHAAARPDAPTGGKAEQFAFAKQCKADRVRACRRTRRLLTRALDGIAGGHEDKSGRRRAYIAALTIPGVSLHDAREAVYPAVLSREDWADIVAKLAGITPEKTPPEGVLRLVPTGDRSWLTVERARRETRSLVHDQPAEKLLKEPGTRVLWHPEIQAEAARLVGERLTGTDAVRTARLRACFDQFHDAVRKRFRLTMDGHYERAALPLRLLAAPRERTTPLDEEEEKEARRAPARCYGVIRAARIQFDPSAEAQVHRWLSPYLRYLPPHVAQRLVLHRAELLVVTTAITFATLSREPRWCEDARAGRRLAALCRRWLRHVEDQLLAWREGAKGAEARDFERMLGINRWLLDRIDAEHRRGAHGGDATGSAPGDADAVALRNISCILDAPGSNLAEIVASTLANDPSKALALLKAVRKRRRGGAKVDRGDVFACFLVAQAAISQAIEPPWRPMPSSPADDHLAKLAEGLLKEALHGMERSWSRRSFAVARLLLSFDLRLAQGKGPDITFLGPVRAPLERLGGGRTREQLHAAREDAAHRELLAHEEEESETQKLWREVSYLATLVRQARP